MGTLGRGVLLVDGGDLLFPEEPVSEDEVAQRRLKAELILDANKEMKIDAAAVGDQDLKLGVEYLRDLAKAKNFPFLSANIVGIDGKTVFAPHVIKDVCSAKVGIFSVITATDHEGKPTVPGPTYRVEDPIETAKKEVAALKAAGAQIIVALSHLGITDDHRLAREVPGIDFVFGGHSRSLMTEPQKEGSTYLFQAGYRTKELGRVDFEFREPLPGAIKKLVDASAVIRVRERVKTYTERMDDLKTLVAKETDPDRKTMYEDQIAFYTEQLSIESKSLPAMGESASEMKNTLVDLNREIVDEPAVATMVKKVLDEMSAMPATSIGASPDGNGLLPGPAAGPFVGAKVCQACHIPEFTAWAGTDHAKAYKSLVTEQHHLDFDCVGCHSTGYRAEGGPKDPFTIGGLTSVQCEVCHGPGREHSADPKGKKLRVEFDEKFCRTCHSQEQTGDRFVFAQYLPKIVHLKK